MDLTVAEKKATYEGIQYYVLEHTGLKVSTKQPQCPPDKGIVYSLKTNL
ncbi:MAG: hypothetical protein K2N63_03805 [Lachnospiraceae bacterium]|nr:hypothetical protein [Lachnospiraceae bacterium]